MDLAGVCRLLARVVFGSHGGRRLQVVGPVSYRQQPHHFRAAAEGFTAPQSRPGWPSIRARSRRTPYSWGRAANVSIPQWHRRCCEPIAASPVCRSTRPHTRCGIPSRRTYLPTAAICARSRTCWVMPACRRRSAIPQSTTVPCSPCGTRRIREGRGRPPFRIKGAASIGPSPLK